MADLEKYRFEEDPRKLDEQDLLLGHHVVHNAWAIRRDRGEVTVDNQSRSAEELITYHALIVADMGRRGFKHQPADDLDEQSGPVEKQWRVTAMFDPLDGLDVPTTDLRLDMVKGVPSPISVFGRFPRAILDSVLGNVPTATKNYVEAFTGPAQVFYRKESGEHHEVLSDLDPHIIGLHKAIRDLSPKDVARLRHWHWGKISKDEWKSLIDREPYPDPIRELHRVLVLKRNSVGGFARRAKTCYRNENVGNFRDRALQSIERAHDRIGQAKNLTLRVADFGATIAKYDSPETFFFMDPPYCDADEWYKFGFPVAEVKRMLAMASAMKGRFVILHNPHAVLQGNPHIAHKFRWPSPMANLGINRYSDAAKSKGRDRVLYVLSNVQPFKKALVPGGIEAAEADNPANPFLIAGPSDADVSGPVITAKAVVDALDRSFKMRSPFIYLVGSMATHGQTDGQVDFLVKDAGADAAVRKMIEWRILRALPEAMWSRVRFHYDQQHGPFSDNVPLYDLTVERINPGNVVLQMDSARPEIEKDQPADPPPGAPAAPDLTSAAPGETVKAS